MLWPRFLYQEGITQLKLKNYDQAVHYFNRAEKKVPGMLSKSFARADMFRIYTHYGRALYHSGIRDWKDNGPSKNTYTILRRGKSYLIKADAISPVHYLNSYWLTRSEEALERLHRWLFRKIENPYDAYSFYQKTLPLRPAGSTVRYAYIRYLNDTKRYAELPAAVQNLMEIHPPSYFHLLKEPFFSETLHPHIIDGLLNAFNNDVLPRTAAKALSDIHMTANDYGEGITYYKLYLKQDVSLNSSWDYIRLGTFYLKYNQPKESFNWFKESLLAGENNRHLLNRIYGIFKKEDRLPDFPELIASIEKDGIQVPDAGMILARCRMAMGQYDQAKEIVTQIISEKPTAAAHHLLATIAGKEKNWDRMELSAHKASRLDRKNSHYYHTLAQSLFYQKKYTRAEEAITSAIQYAPRENPWYYNLRANALWAREEYPQAVADWEKAFSLKPDRADFPYRIALGLEKQAQFDKALAYLRKAMALAPDNATYKAFEKRLESYTR